MQLDSSTAIGIDYIFRGTLRSFRPRGLAWCQEQAVVHIAEIAEAELVEEFCEAVVPATEPLLRHKLLRQRLRKALEIDSSGWCHVGASASLKQQRPWCGTLSPPPSPPSTANVHPPAMGAIDLVSLARDSNAGRERVHTIDSENSRENVRPPRASVWERTRATSDPGERTRAASDARHAATAQQAKKAMEEISHAFEVAKVRTRCPVFNPYDRRMRYWEWTVMAFLCYQAIEMPLRLAFESSFYSAQGLFVCLWVEFASKRCSTTARTRGGPLRSRCSS
jgi:hypothetical protein